MLFGANNKKTRALATCVLLIASLVGTVTVHARQPANAEGQQTVRLAELPSSGKDTYQRILAGGPFTYEKDGVVFGNRERLLPPRQRQAVLRVSFSRRRMCVPKTTCPSIT